MDAPNSATNKITKKNSNTPLKLDVKLKIIQDLEKGGNISEIAQFYKTTESAIRKIKKNSDQTKQSLTQLNSSNYKVVKYAKTPFIKEMENMLLKWMEENKNMDFNHKIVKEKALQIFDELMKNEKNDDSKKLTKFVASKGWFQRFKKRCGFDMNKSSSVGEQNLKEENMNYRGNTSPFSFTSLDSRDSTSNGSPMSSSMSPMSGNMSSPESVQYTLHEMDMNLNDCINVNINQASAPLIQIFHEIGTPYLEIKEQPVDKFRFRYRSEMMGTHGSLMAKSSEKGKKIYPTVELKNYTGKAIIRCSLYQVDEHNRSPHTHHLVLRNAGNNEESNDPHDVQVDSGTGYVTVFPGMGIIHTAKKYIASELVKKQLTMYTTRNIRITQNQMQELKDRAQQDARSMNLNSVCLCFEAFEQSTMEPLCEKVFSTPINNMKSALTGELKITRLSKTSSSCLGGEDVFLFVEKVGKKNIKVRFYELDDNDTEIWEAYGIFSELDVHHQYAIALRTPAYRNLDIESSVQVNIQLYRPSDGDFSDPITFIYKPSQRISSSERKRARTGSCFNSSELMANLPSILQEIPQECSYYSDDYASFDKYLQNTEAMNSDEFKNFFASVPEELKKTFCQIPVPYSENMALQIDGCFGNDIVQEEKKKPIKINNDSSQLFTNRTLQKISLQTQKDALSNKKGSEAQIEIVEIPKHEDTIQPEMMDIKEYKTIDYRRMLNKLQKNNEDNPNFLSLKSNGPTDTLKSQLANLLKLSKSPLLKYDSVKKARNAKAVEDLFFCGTDGNTALHEAVRNDQMDIAHYMLSLIVQYDLCDLLNKRNIHGQSILHSAIANGNYIYIKPLLAAGIDANITDNDEYSPLHLAILKRNINAVTHLLNKTNYKLQDLKIDVNKRTSDGKTALHLATSMGSPEIVQRLMLAQVDINLPEMSLGNTALHIAVEKNHEYIVRLLLACSNIKVNIFNRQGHTPLHLACVVDTGSKPGSEYIVKLLLEAKADPSLSYYSTSDNVEIKQEPISDDEDNETEPVIENITAFDLAKSNPNILQRLKQYASINTSGNADQVDQIPDHELIEKADLEIRPDLSTLVKEEAGPTVIFDEECVKETSEILDKSGNWEKLAELLDYSSLVSIMKNSESPTKVLLGHIENAGISLQTIIDLLRALDEDEAVEAIDYMVARQTTNSMVIIPKN